MIKNYLHYAVAAAFVVASGASNLAFAVDEAEPNDSFILPQRLVVLESDNHKIVIEGKIGTVSPAEAPISDVDFYSFFGKAGETITVNIDGGMKSNCTRERCLNSMIAVFKPDGTVLLQANDTLPIDSPGSIHRFDPRLENVYLSVSGIYKIGVASDARYPDGTMRVFTTGGEITPFLATSVSNGSYLLILEGVSPSAIQIEIDVKPGLDRITRVNPKAKGTIPVALLSSKDKQGSVTFDPLKADRDSIKFGPTGTEASGRCNRGPDANRDGIPDLLCHFDMEAAGFDESDTNGMVTGTIGGMPFEGRGWLKVIPVGKD